MDRDAKLSGESEWSGGISAMNQNYPLAANLSVCEEVHACIRCILYRTLLFCSVTEFLCQSLNRALGFSQGR